MKITHALMAELVDATDLKSVIRKGVRVRVPLGAPSFLRGYDMSSFYNQTNNMTLDVYSGGFAIEHLRESMGKLSYSTEIEVLIKKFK